MDLAKESGIDFAFPTRTPVIETASGKDAEVLQAPMGAILGRR
jgi:hypothetical protein